jgi:tetratricopeptide (TPR) repeat protein
MRRSERAMSEADRDPTAMSSAETDKTVMAEGESTAWVDVDDEELGEALGEALTEAATTVADEALAEAQRPRRRKKRTKPGKNASGSWIKRLDGTMAIVLFSNLLFMGLILFLPDPPKESGNPEPQGGAQASPDPTPAPKDPTPVEGQALESRVIQLAEIEGLIRVGRFEEAVQKIEATLKSNPDLPPMVRRSLYSRLANYSAEAGNHEKALHYLKLSSNGFQMSLLPKDLWQMAQDASKLGDQPGARKYLARFLLQESLMGEQMEGKIPAAYLRLGDGYRIQASEAEKGKGGK